ncbi:unnamed protein product [Urochloa decumbens]|uniref:Major facilitator superfamily (MFS) profile domain-containing protein n=1 Tax=Urochloa decumbens TaxID=240449 RepID=A0ABC9F1M8_9POAL
MESFLSKFFPEVVEGRKNAKVDAYCKYDNQWLTAFTSSLWIAGTLSSLVASRVTRWVGRQAIMLIGGALFLAGSVINAAAVNIAMLIIGRMLLGFGLGFTLQVYKLNCNRKCSVIICKLPLYWPSCNIFPGFNILVATGRAGVLVRDSASEVARRLHISVQRLRGHRHPVRDHHQLPHQPDPQLGMARLSRASSRAGRRHRGGRIRGGDGADVDAEFKDMVRAVDAARRNDEGAFRRLFSREYRHYLAIGVAIPVFYEFTGMIVISIFSPVLFRTPDGRVQQPEGYTWVRDQQRHELGLHVAVLRRHGPHRTQVPVRCRRLRHDVLRGKHGGVTMPRSYATGVLVLICMCTFSFGLSWAPLRWVVPSEIYPVEVRSAGQAMSISITLCISFVELQVFIALLCAMKYAVFLFYAAWLLAMTVFVVVFLPETKGVPLEAMQSVWARHWYWRRFAKDAKEDNQDDCL